MNAKRGGFFAPVLFLAMQFPGLALAAGLRVHDAWIEEGPPGMTVMAAYMDVENTGDSDIHITHVSSSAVHQIEIHKTEIKNGTASMVQLPELLLPAHQRLKFEQGGYHLMLMGIEHPLKAGDSVELQIESADGDSLKVTAPVRRATDAK